jgi:predicted kinase
MYEVDYPADKVAEYQDEADLEVQKRLATMLDDKSKDILLDLSFYSKKDREEVKQLAESKDTRWVLVYFKAEKDVLRRRIAERRAGPRNADSAFEVTEEILESYVNGFEAPNGECEIVVAVV